MRACVGSCTTTALFLMKRAREAYLSVLRVSSRSASLGETHASITVRELPPRLSCSNRVSFESRYGTCCWFSQSALITLPSARRPLLIWMPSFSRSPLAPVRFARSDPARSTKCILGVKLLPSMRSSSDSVKTACERDEVAFMLVAPVARLRPPSVSRAIASA